MYKTKADLFQDVTGSKPGSADEVESFSAVIVPYFARVNPKLPEIVIKRYAIGRTLGMTFDEIGDDLEMSGAYARQILQKGILFYKYDKHRPEVKGGEK
jgi:DNA-directed RNA polymerase sigma subunit (sigma70/sigma32)